MTLTLCFFFQYTEITYQKAPQKYLMNVNTYLKSDISHSTSYDRRKDIISMPEKQSTGLRIESPETNSSVTLNRLFTFPHL